MRKKGDTKFMNKLYAMLLLCGCATGVSAKPLKEIKTIMVCKKSLQAEVAKSEADRSKGLGGRKSIAQGKAMIFVFEEARELSFWMKDVPFDIDIGFFDAKGKYVSHSTMPGTSPLQLDSTLPTYSSYGAAKYAVEVSKGFYSNVDAKNCQLTPLL